MLNAEGNCWGIRINVRTVSSMMNLLKLCLLPFWLMFKAMGFMLKFLLVPLIILGFIADDGKGVF